MNEDAEASPAPKPSPAASFAPRVFGDYLLTAELGHGGMGSVFLAKRLSYSPDIQRFCAVKTISATAARSDFVRRFHDEARAVVTMNHPGICHVFDVGIVDGAHYLAMELIEGVSLQELQRARARAGEHFPTPLVLTIADAVLDALEYAHERRDPATGRSLHIVHRDVSPQNVMIAFNGAVKLIDFGLATSAVREEQTVGGVVVGKVAYMAPEHARGEALDARADVYSVAVLLYELLAGRRFYAGLSKNALMMHLTEGTWMPPLDVIPEAVRAPLARALAPEASARTPSCAALQGDLYAAEPARAPARELRSVLEHLVPEHLESMAARLRGAATVPPPPSEELSRATVTHVARSDEHPAVQVVTASVTRPTRAERRPLALVAVALAGALLTWLAWWALATPGDAPSRVAADGGKPSAATPAVAPPSVTGGDDAGALPQAPVGTDDDDAGALGVAPATDAGPAPTRLGTGEANPSPDPPLPPPPRVRGPARPPKVPLPDLAAQLDYLERWCGARAPACTRGVLSQRSKVPLLDAAGLSALRREAAECVVQCRR